MFGVRKFLHLPLDAVSPSLVPLSASSPLPLADELAVQSLWAHTPSQIAKNTNSPHLAAAAKIIGRFQKIKTIRHPGLCQYIAIQKGKRDRLFIVSASYPRSIQDYLNENGGRIRDLDLLDSWIQQILHALCRLHKNGIVHRNLALKNILLDPANRIKLSDYGLFHITGYGADSFPDLGVSRYPLYLPAEALASDRTSFAYSDKRADTYSLGIILLQMYSPETFSSYPSDTVSLSSIITQSPPPKIPSNVPSDLAAFIEICLSSFDTRPTARELMTHSFLAPLDPQFIEYYASPSILISDSLDSLPSAKVLSALPLPHMFHLWRLFGNDIERLLISQGHMNTPPIERLPYFVRVDETDIDQALDTHDPMNLYDDRVWKLDLLDIRSKIEELVLGKAPSELSAEQGYEGFDFNSEALQLVLGSDNTATSSCSTPISIPGTPVLPTSVAAGNPNTALQRLDLKAREKNPIYQYYRITLFMQLLREYPASKSCLIREARIDVPPILRGRVWAALMDIEGDPDIFYAKIDKESPNEMDRQLELDIPRCHQYNELLCSPEGHEKLKRVLKAWITHEEGNMVYWQGLDSMCAPFLALSFEEESLAFSCAQRFISDYSGDLFVTDNSKEIKLYIETFIRLISFHDSALSTHLHHISCTPDLYAIPWFMTKFAHVLHLDRIYQLWDKLLCGPKWMYLLAAVAVLRQLKDELLRRDFNHAMLLFSELPEMNMENVTQDMIKLCRLTPLSFIPGASGEPIEQLTEMVPTIDLTDFEVIQPWAFVIDLRDIELFEAAHIPGSVNMPCYNTAFMIPHIKYLLQQRNNHYIVVTGHNTKAISFATTLVLSGVNYVAILGEKDLNPIFHSCNWILESNVAVEVSGDEIKVRISKCREGEKKKKDQFVW